MTRVLRPEPLTAEAFKPFGDVIETRGTPEAINYGNTQKFADLTRVAVSGGTPTTHLYRSTPPKYPFALRVMENHPLGSQMFVPLSGNAYLVVVAPKGPFDAAGIRAFVASPKQGVNLAPGTWHHFNLALGGVSEFLVIDRDGPGDNLEEIALNGSILLEAP